MSQTVKQLAQEIGGEVLGDGEVEIFELKATDEATDRSICPLLRKRALLAVPALPAAVVANRALSAFALERDYTGFVQL